MKKNAKLKEAKTKLKEKFKKRAERKRNLIENLCREFEAKTILNIETTNVRMTPIQIHTKVRWVEECRAFLLKLQDAMAPKKQEPVESVNA